MVTIYDIAKKTGYSAPTISKALNGTGGLSQDTRDKIKAIAIEMGYRPNMTARALITKKSYLIGIVFEDEFMNRGFEHPLFGGVLNQFRKEMDNAGFDVLFLSKNCGKGAIQRTYLEHCLYRSVDAVLIVNSLGRHKEYAELVEAKIPCVAVNDVLNGIPAVLTDNVTAGYNATNYFIENGHTKIAYIAGSTDKYTFAAEERRIGYEKALIDNNIAYDPTYVEQCPDWYRATAYRAMEKLLQKHNDITAVFVANDSMAIGAMECAKSHGLKIPEDISFIGFDDENFSSLCNPSLSSFKQDRIQIAEIAAEILLNSIIELPVPKITRIPAEFISRDSVRNLLEENK